MTAATVANAPLLEMRKVTVMRGGRAVLHDWNLRIEAG